MSRRALLAALLAASAVLCTPATASAHATLVTSAPADGAHQDSAPSEVVLTFDEPVSIGGGGFLQVTDQTGHRVDAGPVTHPAGDGAKVRVALRAGLGDGAYLASYRIVSPDSHAVAGAIRFAVGNAVLDVTAAPSGSGADGLTETLFALSRWLGFLGLVGIAGGWIVLVAWQRGRVSPDVGRLVWTGWAFAVAATVLEAGLQGPYVAGTAPGGLFDAGEWDATLHTTYGTMHAVRLILLGGLAAVIGAIGPRRRRVDLLTLPLMAGVAVTYAGSGHAYSQSPRWLSVLAESVHVLSVAAWLGGLVVLVAVVLRRAGEDDLRAALPVISRVAAACVVMIAATGVYQAWRGVGVVDALTGTTYGRLVVFKLSLFVGIVLLGNISRATIAHGYGHTERAVARMRVTVAAEVGLAAVVLLATAFLVAKPPGRAALAVVQARPKHAEVTLSPAGQPARTADVTIQPGRHGVVTVAIALSNGLKPVSVTATASLPKNDLGPIPLVLSDPVRGPYVSEPAVLPVAGDWVISMTARMSEFDSTTATATIHLD